MLTEFAPAKLNLFLHVLGKRADGMHDLESLAVFLELGDHLSLVEDEPFGLEISGPKATSLVDAHLDENLIVKAARGVSEIFGQPLNFALKLEKYIPVAAGLGGGSADAAACIRLLCKHWQKDRKKNWRQAEVLDLATNLGADVPVCLESKACIMRGIGDELTFVKANQLDLVLVNPNVGVSTKDVFQALNLECGETRRPAMVSPNQTFLDLVLTSSNDMQSAAIGLQPKIQDCLTALGDCQGVSTVRMTGSGATCFGLFQNAGDAKKAVEEISAKMPYAWVNHSQQVLPYD